MAWVLKMDDASIESGLVHDFDASLSGIGQELGAGAYSMRLESGVNMSTPLSLYISAHAHPMRVQRPLSCPCVCVCVWFLSVLGEMASPLFWDLEGDRRREPRSGTEMNSSQPHQRKRHVLYCDRRKPFDGSCCCLQCVCVLSKGDLNSSVVYGNNIVTCAT